MADIYDQLDDIAEEFAEKVNLATAEMVEYLMELVDGKTSEEALQILSQINLEVAMEMKLAKAFTSYEVGIVDFLRSSYTTATISESTLRLLLNNTKAMISDEVTRHLSKVSMQSIIDGIATNLTPLEVIATIDQKLPRVQTLVNAAYSQFSNSITNMMAEQLPDNTKFIYIGAYDSRTRDRCVEKINAGALTRVDVINNFGDMNNEIFNCRHKWEQRSSSPEDQGYNPKKFEE